jgi:hypothetical protein
MRKEWPKMLATFVNPRKENNHPLGENSPTSGRAGADPPPSAEEEQHKDRFPR